MLKHSQKYFLFRKLDHLIVNVQTTIVSARTYIFQAIAKSRPLRRSIDLFRHVKMLLAQAHIPKKLSSFLLVSRTDPSIARNVAVSSRPAAPLIIAYHWDCIMPFFFVKGSKKYIKTLLQLFFISSRMTDGNPHRHARFVHRTCMQ